MPRRLAVLGYSWLAALWLIPCLVFPPFALGYVLLPVWIRRRRNARVAFEATAPQRARAHWVDTYR